MGQRFGRGAQPNFWAAAASTDGAAKSPPPPVAGRAVTAPVEQQAEADVARVGRTGNAVSEGERGIGAAAEGGLVTKRCDGSPDAETDLRIDGGRAVAGRATPLEWPDAA